MKVTLEKDYRKFYTLEDLDHAKAVIAYEKEEDDETAKGWAVYAVNEALEGTNDRCVEVVKADARTAKNCRLWNGYGDTGNMDIWIEALAKTDDGYIEIGAYLSDIFQTGAMEYKRHMWIQRFVKQ